MMKIILGFTSALVAALITTGLDLVPRPVQAAAPAASPKDETVRKYVDDCWSKSAKDAGCDKLRKDAVEILKEDLLTLGSSADRGYLLSILPVFKHDEPELRIAAADAIGMIGPQDGDIDLLAPVANDPVPDVRRAVGHMLSSGKGAAIRLLGQRVQSMRTGLTPEAPPDPVKYALPLAPESTYLYYASDTALGRVSYSLRKGLEPAKAFFKGKAKRGPLKLDEFNALYRYQLSDEREARERIWKEISEARSKQAEKLMKDTLSQKAALEQLMQVQGDSMNQTMVGQADQYGSDIFESPAVFVLEERQIGQRTYPTRYVVLYHDKALRMPGYRLSWMTVPDDAITATQTASLVQEKQEEVRKKEEEGLKKREEALRSLEKKKDEQEKKIFKKGQDDLEKELGF